MNEPLKKIISKTFLDTQSIGYKVNRYNQQKKQQQQKIPPQNQIFKIYANTSINICPQSKLRMTIYVIY